MEQIEQIITKEKRIDICDKILQLMKDNFITEPRYFVTYLSQPIFVDLTFEMRMTFVWCIKQFEKKVNIRNQKKLIQKYRRSLK